MILKPGQLLSKYNFAKQAPTQSFDFTQGVLPSGWTLTRTTTGRYTNSSGQVATAAINASRYQYNYSAGATRGLLIEPQSTNHCIHSEAQGSLTLTRVTVTDNAVNAPDGAATADKVIPTVDNDTHSILHASSASLPPTAFTSYSVYVKAAENRRFRLQMQDNGATGNAIYTDVDLNSLSSITPTALGNATFARAGYESLADGWVRIYVSGVCNTSGTTTDFIMQLYDNSGNASFAGDGTSGLYVWGSQCEATGWATSYIPTAGASATRGADVCQYTNITSQPWWSTTAASFVLDIDYLRYQTTNGIVLGIGSGGTNRFNAYRRSADQGFQVQSVQGANVVALNYTDVEVTPVDRFKFAVGMDATKLYSTVNGAGYQEGATFTLSSLGGATLYMAYFNGTLQPNMCIRSLKYYDSKLSTAQLKAVTR